MNYLFLLCLYIFIMALLGMEFYAYRIRVDHDGNPIKSVNQESFAPDQNFDTFLQALITVFCLLVNEDWHIILYQYRRTSDNEILVTAYITVVVVIGNFLLLQLFLAILIQNFSNATEIVAK